MRYTHLFPLSLCVFILFSCTESLILPPSEEFSTQNGAAFTLTATTRNPDTRLSFDDDCLGMTWQPGDKLFLVDITGKKSTVTLTTDITSPSKRATFSSGSISVLTGDYVVLYGTSQIEQSYCRYQMKDLKSLEPEIKLYGSLSVVDGQTSANIALSHVYARLSLKFRNVPDGLRNMNCGMAACTIGLPFYESGSISTDGWTPDKYVPTQSFSWNDGADSYVLIPPEDYSNTKVYFYVCGEDANGSLIAYEFLKDGINIQSGINYNVTIDFSRATTQTIIKRDENLLYPLSKPEDFRAAAFWTGGGSFYVANDVDFSGHYCFPIRGSLIGKGHVLKNAVIDLSKCSEVGIVSNGNTGQLVIKAASITGLSSVGGLVGRGYAIECGFEGEVKGKEKVGGIVGDLNNITEIYSCYSVGKVSGSKYVGGILGYFTSKDSYLDYELVCDSYFIGTVTGDSYVGGISGYNGYPSCCYSYGTVSSGYGIEGYGFLGVNNCLTSMSIMGPHSATNDNCNCGPNKTFFSKLSVINVYEAFSTQVWSNIDAGCPLLRWQAEAFGGEISAPDFGNQDW